MNHPGAAIRVTVGSGRIDPSTLAQDVSDPGSGATVVFLGTVRDHSPGKTDVTHLEYEVYEGVVEESIKEIAVEAASKWPLLGVAVEHRTGEVRLGEASVGVAVSSSHRADAFDAARYVIDELKTRAPIWKKEHWPGGSEWSQGS
jgi:molybdopterin synthase catalytic subunit